MIVDDCPYECGKRPFLGKLVYSSQPRPRPIVLFGPNWMGVSADAVERAKMLAGNRYVVFVADPYGQGCQPSSIAEAAPLADALRKDTVEHRRRIVAALEVATAEAARRDVGDTRLRAAIGFCFGGGSVLELARSGADLAAVVSIHGHLVTDIPAQASDLRAAVLALHGSEDPVAPKSQRDAFEAEMRDAKANWRLMIFGGVIHAFTDVGADVPNVARYDRAATAATYEIAHAFLRDAFAGEL